MRTASAIFACGLLVDVIWTVVRMGAPALSLGFLIHNSSGLAGGGIANALIGTALIVAFAAVVALPVGILTAIYLTEFSSPRSRVARTLQGVLDMLQGMPTIIVGIVVYGLIVSTEHKETGFAGSIALAIIMLPLIARSSQEVLKLVPGSLREAADALGVPHWRAVLSVILPTAIGGIATGAILSIARASGETAPLLFVNSLYNPGSTQLMIFGHGVPNIPMLHLHARTTCRPRNAVALRLGRGTRAADVHPACQHRRPDSARTLPCEDGDMTTGRSSTD